MLNTVKGPARALFPARQRLDKDLLAQMMAQGSIIIDNRRRRPLYFDGRFLAARDLTREQAYFLLRQADLGRAIGQGIVSGLMVSPGPTSSSIQISAGHGTISTGELVVLGSSVTIDLTNIPEIQRLNAAFGLIQIPRESPRNRSGLFIIALRPVEFTANPIASYPTSIDDKRTVEDGDIVEAVAVSLIPYRDDTSNSDIGMRRAHAAHEIFVNRATRGIPAGALPLAMIALDGSVIRWIDPYLARREVGAEHGDVLGLGFAPRALREAHLLQYHNHLEDIIAQRRGQGLRFAASQYFEALPPAGRMPAAAIDPQDFTQIFFPPEIETDLSIIPQDEAPALLEESLLLPPIDLTLGGDEQDSTSVLVLVPVARERIRVLMNTLTSFTRALKPAAPGLVAKRKPLEALQGLFSTRLSVAVALPESPIEAAWREALRGSEMLWYARRRNLQYKVEVIGVAVRAHGQELRDETELNTRLANFGLSRRFASLKKIASTRAAAEMISLISSPKFGQARLLAEAVLQELEEAVAPVDAAIPEIGGEQRLERAGVLKVAERYADPQLGEGIANIERVNAALVTSRDASKNFAAAGIAPELDRIGRLLNEEDLKAFSEQLQQAIDQAQPEQIKEMVINKLREIQ